jgi:preprotein translocase subunit SecA
MHTIWSDFARMVYNVEVEIEGENGVPQQQRGLVSRQPSLEYSGGTSEDQPTAYGGDGGEAVAEEPVAVQQRRVDANEQLGRNDPCWCGSGKKFKKCHGA